MKKIILWLVAVLVLVSASLLGYYFKSYNPEAVQQSRIVNSDRFENGVLYYSEFKYDKSFSYTPATVGLDDFSPFNKYLVDFLHIKYSAFFDATKYNYQSFPKEGETFGYYILVDKNIVIDTSKIYDKAGLKIIIQKSDQNLLSYLKNPLYCQVDGDCAIRNRECAYGSFNKFNEYHGAWGCEGTTFYPNESEKESKFCDVSKKYWNIEYSGGSKCINYKCSPANKKITCIEGVLP